MTTWGLSATIKAPAAEIVRFAAYHLGQGAHRLYIYLDDDNPTAFAACKAHPKIRVTHCDDAHWRTLNNGRRPVKHQVRQTFNATHAYNRPAEVDWLIHIDVDEFLVPEKPISEILATQPAEALCARVRPMEALATDTGFPTHFKAFVPNGKERLRIVRALYPTFGDSIKGGFLSHLAGKVLVRTGLDNVRVQIHNAFQNDVEIPTAERTEEIGLAHFHTRNWDQWIGSFHYRLDRGSYRAELGGNRSTDQGKLTIHQMFQVIFQDSGEAGLRAFFDEVCADTPALRSRLEQHGLLRQADLDLDATISRFFPEYTDS